LVLTCNVKIPNVLYYSKKIRKNGSVEKLSSLRKNKIGRKKHGFPKEKKPIQALLGRRLKVLALIIIIFFMKSRAYQTAVAVSTLRWSLNAVIGGSPNRMLAMMLPAKHTSMLETHVDNGCRRWKGWPPADTPGQYMSILFHIYSLNESSLTSTYQMTSKRNIEVTNMPPKHCNQIILLVRSFRYIMI